MICINEYIQKPKPERQSHLSLDIECLERGGNSTDFRGLLAHVLDTTIPKGSMIQLCHACNNAKCSRIEHLYWGTASENRRDRMAIDPKTGWDYMVEKHGEDRARQMQSENGRLGTLARTKNDKRRKDRR